MLYNCILSSDKKKAFVVQKLLLFWKHRYERLYIATTSWLKLVTSDCKSMLQRLLFFFKVYIISFANNFIAQVFFIINRLNLFALLFCTCIFEIHNSKKMRILLHHLFVLIQLISLSDYITLTTKLYYNISQVTKSVISKRFSFFLADWVKYIIAILVGLYITTIT